MAIEKKLKSAKSKLIEAQQLMSKIQKQNENWPGVGAFQKDITTARTLLDEIQQSLSDIFVGLARDHNKHLDSDREIRVSQDFSETYSLMSKLYGAVNKVDLCFNNRLSQKDALVEIEKYPKKLLNHCVTVRDHLNEVGYN